MAALSIVRSYLLVWCLAVGASLTLTLVNSTTTFETHHADVHVAPSSVRVAFAANPALFRTSSSARQRGTPSLSRSRTARYPPRRGPSSAGGWVISAAAEGGDEEEEEEEEFFPTEVRDAIRHLLQSTRAIIRRCRAYHMIA